MKQENRGAQENKGNKPPGQDTPGNSTATALAYSVIQINKYISNMDV